MSDKEGSHSASPEAEENGSTNGINDDGVESPRRRSRDRKGSRSVSRSRSRSRSRDRSHKRSHRRRRSYSRSRSRSPRRERRRHRRSRSRSFSRSDSYDRDRYRRRSRSRSPMSSRKRHIAPRDDPPASRCVGVFGMSLYTDEKTITNFFSQFGKIEQIQLVYDKKTGRSRGFGFIYYENTDDAVNAKERAAGAEIDGHRIRVDFSITKRPHTPTPGIYMGKPTRRRGDDYYRGRSPSPYYSRGRRSRSYSYSPRRE